MSGIYVLKSIEIADIDEGVFIMECAESLAL